MGEALSDAAGNLAAILVPLQGMLVVLDGLCQVPTLQQVMKPSRHGNMLLQAFLIVMSWQCNSRHKWQCLYSPNADLQPGAQVGVWGLIGS